MEGILREVPFIRHVVACGALRDRPLTLLDIGCSGGLDPVWREFEPALAAHGVDPMPTEIGRLRANERNPRVHYHCAFLNLPPDHPFARLRGDRPHFHHNPWDHLSAAWGRRLQADRDPNPTDEDILVFNRWNAAAGIEQTPTLTPAELLARTGEVPFDFIKIDIDGPDFGILVGLEERLSTVLGVGLEVNFFGSHVETDHTFHNVDRFMRRAGFSLKSLTVQPYSRDALPAPFAYPTLAQTTFGAPYQGDAVYLRDVVVGEYSRSGATLDADRLLKLACLYSLCNLPDGAAEILIRFRDRLQARLDIDRALDLLAPPMADGKVPYKEYMARFAGDLKTWFFPPYHPPAPIPEPQPQSANPKPRLDIWRTGHRAAKFALAALLVMFVAEAARAGRGWPVVVFFVGVSVWAGAQALARIPNKKRALRKLRRFLTNRLAPTTPAGTR